MELALQRYGNEAATSLFLATVSWKWRYSSMVFGLQCQIFGATAPNFGITTPLPLRCCRAKLTLKPYFTSSITDLLLLLCEFVT
ncbi:hypothetical protein PanWU01x14_358200 [Parasponia andersonii]|uniref:Uncharacterized protein n=1 Tax=Parasponia andersonii TaxID=3476 RepID=A0A2P5A8E6_PARAD|nr:hypothetical protein PanWU01x14_358200 [Parasponia andersonii]